MIRINVTSIIRSRRDEFMKRYSSGKLLRSFKVLSRADRIRIILLVSAQTIFSLLDLLGVATIGVIGALAISGVQSKSPGNRVSSLLNTLNLDGYGIQIQVAVLATGAVLLLVSKTLFSIYFTRKSIRFLARKGAELSAQLISKLLSQSLVTLQSKSLSEMIYSLTSGVSSVTIGVLATAVNVVSDFAVLIVIGIGLFYVDSLIALCVFSLFGAVAFILYKTMHERASNLGKDQAEIGIKANEKTLEVITSYREVVVQNRRNYYARMIGARRLELADIQSEIAFMPNMSKYVMEITMVVGAILLSAIQFVTQNASHAVAILSVFLAASTRIAPSLLRIQQGVVLIKSSLASAEPTLDLIDRLESAPLSSEVSDFVQTSHPDFEAKVKVEKLTFLYPESKVPAVEDVDLEILPGTIVALVGPSGAGKTSLMDLILGVLTPQFGDITISGCQPLETIAKWPGAISYVPQDIMIANGTIRENVSMGYPVDQATDQLVWDALKVAQLDDFVRSLPLQLDQPAGDRGGSLSGGQRQRLGIARAMFTKPSLLFLDEATSALDGSTEAEISDAIQEMKGTVTIVMIAHRLTTVKKADVVCYIENGRIISSGSFENVRRKVPNFDQQAQLLGL